MPKVLRCLSKKHRNYVRIFNAVVLVLLPFFIIEVLGYRSLGH